MTALALSAGLLVTGANAAATEDVEPRATCQRVKGRFEGRPAPSCSSPVGFCTQGELSGDLSGRYAFVMTSLARANDASSEDLFVYTGTSMITVDSGGTLFGIDHGTVDLGSTGNNKSEAVLTIIAGLGAQAGKSGYLELRGKLALENGEVDGKYKGQLCGP